MCHKVFVGVMSCLVVSRLGSVCWYYEVFVGITYVLLVS